MVCKRVCMQRNIINIDEKSWNSNFTLCVCVLLREMLISIITTYVKLFQLVTNHSAYCISFCRSLPLCCNDYTLLFSFVWVTQNANIQQQNCSVQNNQTTRCIHKHTPLRKSRLLTTLLVIFVSKSIAIAHCFYFLVWFGFTLKQLLNVPYSTVLATIYAFEITFS